MFFLFFLVEFPVWILQAFRPPCPNHPGSVLAGPGVACGALTRPRPGKPHMLLEVTWGLRGSCRAPLSGAFQVHRQLFRKDWKEGVERLRALKSGLCLFIL